MKIILSSDPDLNGNAVFKKIVLNKVAESSRRTGGFLADWRIPFFHEILLADFSGGLADLADWRILADSSGGLADSGGFAGGLADLVWRTGGFPGGLADLSWRTGGFGLVERRTGRQRAG